MTYEEEIAAEKNKISLLRADAGRIKIPRRTINYQFRNMKGTSPNITRMVLVSRLARRKIEVKIKQSELKILSLRQALLGEP